MTIMHSNRIRDLGLVWSILVAGCAGPARLSTQWTDPAFRSSTLRQVMVLGGGAPGNAAALERGFARALAASGVGAIAGRGGAPDAPADSAGWWARAAELGSDAVLVTRLVGARTIDANYSNVTSYVAVPPGYSAGWYSYWLAVRGGGDATANAPVRLEANLYLHPGNQLVWSAVSETFELSGQAGDPGADREFDRPIETLAQALRPKLPRRRHDR